MLSITIGIQTRLASTRYPEKSIAEINEKPIVTCLLDKVFSSNNWLNLNPKYRLNINVFLLAPTEEKEFWVDYVAHYGVTRRVNVMLVLGDMDDVYERYEKLFNITDPDYIVRLTADCPVIPPSLISKCINMAKKYRFDYCSNVFEGYRTMPDGYDVEIISRKAFQWLMMNIEEGTDGDREHVTTLIRKNADKFKIGHLSGNIDTSDIKLSVDTIEDYQNVKRRLESKVAKDDAARKRGFWVYEY